MSAHIAVVPRNPWTTYAVEVVNVRPEIAGVATYHLRLNEPCDRANYYCEPGQFNMLYLPGIGEAAISVSGRDEDDDSWLHTVRTAGNVTQTLAGLGTGGQLALRGPFGAAWPVEQLVGRDAVFIAGGIGLAPLRPAIRWALEHRASLGRLTLLYGARSPQAILYAEEFNARQNQGLNIEVTVDRTVPGWLGRVGVVTLLLDRLRPLDPSNTAIFTCGPDVMMKYVARSAVARGLPAEQLWFSLERNMQCAVGFCGHCQLGPAFICKDGPVLRYDRIMPFLDTEDL